MPSSIAAARAGATPATDLSQTLELLAGIGQDFAASLDIDDTLRRALSRIAGYLGAEAASLFLLEEDGQTLVCRACYGPVNITGMRMPAGQGIVGRSLQDNTCKMVRNVLVDPDFASAVDDDTGFNTRSILCAPMSVQDRNVGAIELINKRDGDGLFSDGDRNALQVLASSAAMAIINARLTARLIEQERLRREMELAAEIQRNLLPPARGDAFPVCGVNVPARGVSGDFYDHFPLADGRIAFNVGDVSGKGMNAALLMAQAAGLYRCLGKTVSDPAALLATINRELCETSSGGMFVTMVGGLYDPASGMVEFANAGHEPPLLRAADGRYTAYPAEQPPLGILPDMAAEDYAVRRVRLDGGIFYVFTDGVTEGHVDDGMLGAEGVRQLLDELHPMPAAERLDALVAHLTRSGDSLHDDVTVIAVEEPRTTPVDAAGKGAELLVTLRIEARAERLALVRRLVAEIATGCGCGAQCVHDIQLAVDEACQNVILHGYGDAATGELVVDIYRKDDLLVFDLVDFAAPVDTEAVRPRPLDELRPGGLGTHFINECMDESGFRAPPAGAGNCLRMVKRIA